MKKEKKTKSTTVRVDVSTSVLRWALSRSENIDTINRRLPKIREWLSGESKPTMRQLEDLARATYTPLGYFFLSEPPLEQLPVPYFRTITDFPLHALSPNLIETVQTMMQRQAWMRDYLIEQGQEALPFVCSVSIEDDPRAVAHEMRIALGLQDGWAADIPNWTRALRELQNRIESIGIILVVNGIVANNTRRKLNPDEFRGFVLVDEYVPLVFVNGADGKAAQMFTLGHELAHVWLGSSAIFDLRELQPASEKLERVSNMIAAEFLVPEDKLREIWFSTYREPEVYQTLARHFKVSELVVARRTLDLGFIKKEEFLDFYHKYKANERSVPQSKKGGNFYATQNLRVGRYFAKTIKSAVEEGKLMYHDAYQLTGLHGKTFERFVETLELGEET
jgi:Zn-dependent peptidase ImmA (M78 family)